MNAYAMTNEQITAYGTSLRMEERCESTVQKYVGAVTALFLFLPPEKTVTRELLLAWKAEISARFSASGAEGHEGVGSENKRLDFRDLSFSGIGNRKICAFLCFQRPVSLNSD